MVSEYLTERMVRKSQVFGKSARLLGICSVNTRSALGAMSCDDVGSKPFGRRGRLKPWSALKMAEATVFTCFLP